MKKHWARKSVEKIDAEGKKSGHESSVAKITLITAILMLIEAVIGLLEKIIDKLND